MISRLDFRLRSATLGLIAGLVIVPSARAQQPAQPPAVQQPPQPTPPPTPTPQPGQPVLAQPPDPTSDPPPPWATTLGAGLSLTSGNSETTTFNVSFDVTHTNDRRMMRANGLYLRGSQNGETSVNRTSLAYREQFALTPRAFVFGELDYLRDTFKAIDYLVAPTGGAGYKFIDTEPTKLSADGGVGAVVEQDRGLDHKVDAALTASESFVYQMTPTATLKQATSNLWKTSDFGDRLHTFSVSLALKVSERMQVSLDLLDTFKNRPPTSATKKNDVALIAALIVKYMTVHPHRENEMLKEFKEFATRGNVLDMAVGIIIGAAFGTIVSSFVGEVLMPIIGLFLGGVDFSNFFVVLKDGNPPGPYASLAAVKAAGAVAVGYGLLINNIVNFLIVAFALFMVIKGANSTRRKKEEAPAPAPPREEVLLTEIRDLLARR